MYHQDSTNYVMFFHISLELLVSPDKEAHGAASPKPVFSFQDYKIAKGKQWNSRVKGQPKGGKSKKSNGVVIFISLMVWNKNVCCLKVYVLLYEDGQKALFLPGGKELF